MHGSIRLALPLAALMLLGVDAMAQSSTHRVLRSKVSAAQLRKATKPVKVGTIRTAKHGVSALYCVGRKARLSCALFDGKQRRVKRAKLRVEKRRVLYAGSAKRTKVKESRSIVCDSGDGVIHRVILRGGADTSGGFKIIADTPFREIMTVKQVQRAQLVGASGDSIGTLRVGQDGKAYKNVIGQKPAPKAKVKTKRDVRKRGMCQHGKCF